MTAQNMGKRILTDAGYEVIAVSNGAAAVKKIAEHKPDIIILDVYMPGYTGLEVCEKVRASHETAKTPVLLTVGKMEPYRAEDANRVKADGIIIKPFEASDLLAIVKKLEEKVVPRAVPLADQTIRLDRPPDFSQFERARAEAANASAHEEPQQRPMQAIVEVPDHMATSSAFSDLLGSEPAHMVESLPAPAAPASAMEDFTVSIPPAEFQIPDDPVSVPDLAANDLRAEEAATSSGSAQEFFNVAPKAPELQINLVQASGNVDLEPVDDVEAVKAVASQPEPFRAAIEFPPVAHVETVPEAEEQELHVAPATIEEPPAPGYMDPGMSLDAVSFESFESQPEIERPSAFGSDTSGNSTHNGLGRVSESEKVSAEAPAEVQVSEDDFDARVAAAMAAYDQAAEVETEPQEIAEEPAAHPAGHETASGPMMVETEAPVSFEYIPPVPAEAPAIQVASAGPVQSAYQSGHDSAVAAVKHESELPTSIITAATAAHAEAVQLKAEEAIVAGIESELPVAAVAAAAANSGSDSHQVIADIVHRVMERFKPELIAEIVRELKSSR
jgi:CheY-like chemotaxis protein